MARPKIKYGLRKTYNLTQEEIDIGKDLARINNISESELIGQMLRDGAYKKDCKSEIKNLDEEINNYKNQIILINDKISISTKKKEELQKYQDYKEGIFNQQLEEEKNKMVLRIIGFLNQKDIQRAETLAISQAKRFRMNSEDLLREAQQIFEKEVKIQGAINEIAKTIKSEGLEQAEEKIKDYCNSLQLDYDYLLYESRQKAMKVL